MPASWFRLQGETLFSRLPVRELRVTRTTEAEFGQLVEYPLLGRLRGLDLSDRRLGNAVARMVSWSPYTESLQLLRMRGCGITDEGAFQLSESVFDCQLIEMDVSHNPIGPLGMAALRDRYGDAVRAEKMEWTT